MQRLMREICDEDHGGCMVPTMALHHEHDPDPEMRPAPFTADKREELLHMMIAGVPRIYARQALCAGAAAVAVFDCHVADGRGDW